MLIGYRLSRPNARRDTFGPGADWWRFHSLVRTRRRTRSTVVASKPALTISSRAWSWSTWRSRIASSTSYGGSESWSSWFSRSSADGGRAITAGGITGAPAIALRHFATANTSVLYRSLIGA